MITYSSGACVKTVGDASNQKRMEKTEEGGNLFE